MKEQIQVEALFQSKDFKIGEPIEIVVPKKPEKNLKSLFEKETQDFFIVKTEPFQDKIKITAVALKSGELKMPSIKVENGESSYIIAEKTLKVLENTNEKEQVIKDIKDVHAVYEPDYTIFYLIGIVALFILGYFLFKKLKKSKNHKEIKPVYVKTPYEIAKEAIFKCEEFLKKGELDNFSDCATTGIRAYLEGIFSLPYLEMTTREVKKSLKKSTLSSVTKEMVLRLLETGDRFKFADESLSQEEFEEMFSFFKESVENINKELSDTVSKLKN